METSNLIERVHELTDLELAMLLCLMARENCIIEFDKGNEKLLEQELQLIASNVFGLSHTVIHCTKVITIEDFRNKLLLPVVKDKMRDPAEIEDSIVPSESFDSNSTPMHLRSSITMHQNEPDDGRRKSPIANIVVITDLNEADEQIQIQTLELLRTRRIFTHTEVHTAPKEFVLIVLSSTGSVPLVQHLNDHIFISHHHEREDGYSNLEEASIALNDDTNPISYGTDKSNSLHSSTKSSAVFLHIEDIKTLAELSDQVTIIAETEAYLHNLVVFLRLNRAVAKGVSPIATKHLKLLSRILTTVHGQSYTTPAIVGLAFRKIYRHRIMITTAKFERSVQYGSHPDSIVSILKGVTGDAILENILEEVEVPV